MTHFVLEIGFFTDYFGQDASEFEIRTRIHGVYSNMEITEMKIQNTLGTTTLLAVNGAIQEVSSQLVTLLQLLWRLNTRKSHIPGKCFTTHGQHSKSVFVESYFRGLN